MPRLTLYTGPRCSLCDQAKAVIEKVRAEVPLEVEEVDIAGDAELQALYGTRIPVIALDGAIVLEGKVTEFWLRKALAGEPITQFKLL